MVSWESGQNTGVSPLRVRAADSSVEMTGLEGDSLGLDGRRILVRDGVSLSAAEFFVPPGTFTLRSEFLMRGSFG